MTKESLTIALRAYVEDATEARSKITNARTPQGPSEHTLIFDTETKIDASQQLRFGVYQWRQGEDLHDHGVFFDPDGLSKSEQVTLRRYALAHDLTFLTLAQFIEDIFFGVGYYFRATIVGFNLPFDLSRLAHRHGSARGKMKGGYSFCLSGKPWHPHVQVKHLSRRMALIQFAGIPKQATPRGMRKRGDKVKTRRGFLVDVNTLAAALINHSGSLASLSEFLRVSNPKRDTDEHGKTLKADYIRYAVGDVQATWECYQRLSERYRQQGLAATLEHKIYSEASLGKAYLKEMGVAPWRKMQPDFPPSMLGIILSTYYGGRSEVHMRRQTCQVLYCDFLSMYPTVCTLMGLWKWIVAKGIEWKESTVETQHRLDAIVLADLQQAAIWQSLPTLVRVDANEDIFPVRAKYGDHSQYTIGLNYLTSSSTPLWFTLADCIASKLLTGKAPKVLKAMTFAPKDIQDGLKSIAIAGNPDYLVNPATDDFFRRVIDLRSEVKAKFTQGMGASENQLDSEQQNLKLLANSTSYGIFVELNVEKLDTSQSLLCHGTTGEVFPVKVKSKEMPGQYFHPILATLITGAARLMLAITERLAADAGLDWALCDTDSMAIGKPQEMEDSAFFDKAHCVCEWFTSLNPYATKGPLLKIESQNYRLESGKITKQLEPLFCFAVSAKRYTLFNVDDWGRPVLRKASAHGLGHLLPPYDEANAPRSIPKPKMSLKDLGVTRWQHDLWYRVVAAALAGRPDQPELDLPGFKGAAASRYSATNPNLLRWFKFYNKGKSHAGQVKPFGFMLTYQVRRVGGEDVPRAVAPYHRDPAIGVKKCFDRDTGKSIRVKKLKTYLEALSQYHLHPELKFLGGNYTDIGRTQRRHIEVTSIDYIGKEANRWEEQFHLGYDPEAQIEYGSMPEDLAHGLRIVSDAATQFGMDALANAAGISPQQVSAIVGRRSRPTQRTIAKLMTGKNVLAKAYAREGEVLKWAHSECARLGQRKFAQVLGVDQGNLSRMLRGQRRPSRGVLERLGHMFSYGDCTAP